MPAHACLPSNIKRFLVFLNFVKNSMDSFYCVEPGDKPAKLPLLLSVFGSEGQVSYPGRNTVALF